MRHEILRRLRRGPATNRDLQFATDDFRSGSIARDVARLIHAGEVDRIDGRSGRGKPATYSLRERP
jgi:DNA-binding HxlR family transcriptional regulator